MISVTQPIIPWIQHMMMLVLVSMGCFSLIMGLKVYQMNSKLPINKRTLRFAISSYMWNTGYAMLMVCTSTLTACLTRFFGLMGALLWMSQGPILVVEIANVVTDEKKIVRMNRILMAVDVVLGILLCSPDNATFTTMSYGVTLYSHITYVRIIFGIYVFTIVLVCILLMRRAYLKAILNRDKKFMKYIIFALLTYPFGCISDVVIPALGYPAFPGSCFTCFISMLLLYIGAVRQNAISISLENIAEYIYSSVGSPIVILNETGDIVLANPMAYKFLQLPEQIPNGENIDNYFECDSSLEWEIQKMLTVGRMVYEEKGVCVKNDCVCQLNFSIILDRYNECLCLILLIHDMTQEHKIMEQLERTSEQAISASKAKSVFLAKMSHDIRTPINAIIGMNEMILRESKSETIKEYSRDIENASKTLLSLINDILDLSKIESGKLELIYNNYMTSSLLVDIFNIINIRAKDKNLELKMDIDEKLPSTLYGDEVRMKQIILNILMNAVKYTRRGSVSLKVHYKDLNDDQIEITIEVKDTGIGIKQEELVHIFDSFHRLDEVKNRGIEGTGLGLNIVKSLVNMMSGELLVESEYGVGSTFTVKIPQKVVDHRPIGSFMQGVEEHLEEEQKEKKSLVAPKAHILVVDDNMMNLQVFKGLLKKTLIHIDIASSGEECLQKVKINKYDMIFLDHMMPGMDGVETLHYMQNMKDNLCKMVPTIALTANAIVGAREMYLREGFVGYISKPILYKKLEDILIEFLPFDLIRFQ